MAVSANMKVKTTTIFFMVSLPFVSAICAPVLARRERATSLGVAVVFATFSFAIRAIVVTLVMLGGGLGVKSAEGGEQTEQGGQNRNPAFHFFSCLFGLKRIF